MTSGCPFSKSRQAYQRCIDLSSRLYSRGSTELEAAARQREERLQEMVQQSLTQIAEARQELAERDHKLGQVTRCCQQKSDLLAKRQAGRTLAALLGIFLGNDPLFSSSMKRV